MRPQSLKAMETKPKKKSTFGREARYGNGRGYDYAEHAPAWRLDMRSMSNVRSNMPSDEYRDGWEKTFGKRGAAEAGEKA